ncbi:linoleate 13S-lipoxygenase 2-1, chloroplastic [Ziziphus jujuba]|uniref:Lipoxygenase n=1 Tax=Ziziphus jujuba TaxID=326968 RepID=A0ABM3I9M3_ZIZJJ|nr:linoleate 13S-lipoxygenase 2-1, chloroplastic [Ziziphus jujuba]
MMNPQVAKQTNPYQTLLLLPKPLVHGSCSWNGSLITVPAGAKSSSFPRKQSRRVGVSPSTIKASAVVTPISYTQKTVNVKAILTVQRTLGGFLSNIGFEGVLDDFTDLLSGSLLLELVSAELDPKTGQEKSRIKGHAHKTDCGCKLEFVTYETSFKIPADFGRVGAVVVENEHHKEMLLKDIVLDGFPEGPVNLSCNSWLHSKCDDPRSRVFFTNKSYLPSETPSGLRRLREEELVILRGNGKGERKKFERIYDYDVYNDLGDPDRNADLKRPILGGKDHPYPRRCRTGRRHCATDRFSESKSNDRYYVPRDEAFSEAKEITFTAKKLYSALHSLVPRLEALNDKDLEFPYFTAIDSLFDEGVNLPPVKGDSCLKNILPWLIKAIEDSDDILQFETPETMDRDKFFWLRDAEFARQTLAGLNPCSIQLVTKWRLKSELDQEIYGCPESAMTTEMIEKEIGGFVTVKEAIKQKKLFILDYHDLLLPYVSKVRKLKGTTLYGSRTLFFLDPDDTLRPLAIELTRPKIGEKPQWRQVFTPSSQATDSWEWRLAKAHVLAHDSGYHQLVSHWLRTHCVTEPYIIATNRQLSVMHPIYRLLHPHFRYTMEINALARSSLINADGVIEASFSPGKYAMELSSVAYDKQWRFDLQALPADLISRGMAVEDPTAPHGLKLTIEDYPFANDGLVLWDSIKQWVSDYVNHYYSDAAQIQSDEELQAWWTEIVTVGHADKKGEPWWPELNTPQDLIDIITIIVWVASGHHAAVNFGQYLYAGYFPNRPTIARTNVPTEDHTEESWNEFLKRPEGALLKCFPSQVQATTVMVTLDILSYHSPDEEYLGKKSEAAWDEDPVIKAAFERFSGRLMLLEGIIDGRNADAKHFKNRTGAGVVPYELLKPFSEDGVTGKGVPYSISI